MAAHASAASSSSSSASKHAALAFFDSHPTSFPNLLQRADEATWKAGRTQLAAAIGVDVATLINIESAPDSIPSSAAAAGWLPSAEAEQAEVSAFLAWASGEAKELVRQVVEDLPAAVFAEHSELIARAELVDLSPKGRVDDEVFAQHRDVWEKITRGCAVIRLHPTAEAGAGAGAVPIVRWAVRANRKFTGHEDENQVQLDGKLYVVDHGAGPATHVVVSHKCNGSVLHLAARDIVLWGAADAVPSRWVFLGSKKVHVGAVWNAKGGVQDWLAKMACFHAARHEVVSEMVGFVAPKLAAKADLILASLARWRLVINAEYVSSIGTGPTDNQRIYGLGCDARESFGFLLTSNALSPQGGLGLGLDFMYGLRLLASWGFATVSAFLIPLQDLAQAKAAVIPLPDIEGAVLYYADVRGHILSLEKWKSSNYVIVRAVREKLRPFIFGGRNNAKGIEELLGVLASEAGEGGSALKVVKVALTPQQLQAANVSAKDAKAAAAAAKKLAKKQEKAAAAAGRKPTGQQQQKKNAQQGAGAGAGAAVAAANEAMESLQIDGDDEQKNDVAAAAAAASSASAAASSSPVAPAPAAAPAAGSSYFLEFSHPDLDALGSVLAEMGGSKVGEGRWRVGCPSDAEAEASLRARVAEAYRSAVLQQPLAAALAKVTERVQWRIKAIDHIPLSDAERDAWLRDSALFLAWLMDQLVVHKRWQPKEVMAQYSQMWSIFRDEQRHKQQAEQ